MVENGGVKSIDVNTTKQLHVMYLLHPERAGVRWARFDALVSWIDEMLKPYRKDGKNCNCDRCEVLRILYSELHKQEGLSGGGKHE